MAEWRTLTVRLNQLLAECKILKRDRSVSAADQRDRSEHDGERGQHELSCGAIDHRINSLAGRSDIGEPQLPYRHRGIVARRRADPRDLVPGQQSDGAGAGALREKLGNDARGLEAVPGAV